MRRSSSPVGRGIVAAAIAIGVILLSFPLIAAIVQESPRLPLITTLCTVEALLLAAGAHPLILRPDVIVRPASRVQWQQGLWLALLSLPWAWLIVLSSEAGYFGMALYFLSAWLLPPVTGSLTAMGLAVLTAAGQGYHHGWTTGAVVGPVAAAAVLVAIVLGFRALIAESAARAGLIEELERTQTQLAQSEQQVGVARERARLARELHDTVAQHLSSIQLLLQAAEHAEAADSSERIGQARVAAAEALAEARRVISGLSPAPLASASLPTALARLAGQATARGRVHASFHQAGQERRLPMAVEATLLRIAQEAVANVERHANAQTCEITLTHESDAVTLEVADDGEGFDPEPVVAEGAGADSGFGIPGLRARAAELGGNAAIVAAPGEGTLVSVRIPLEGNTA